MKSVCFKDPIETGTYSTSDAHYFCLSVKSRAKFGENITKFISFVAQPETLHTFQVYVIFTRNQTFEMIIVS